MHERWVVICGCAAAMNGWVFSMYFFTGCPGPGRACPDARLDSDVAAELLDVAEREVERRVVGPLYSRHFAG